MNGQLAEADADDEERIGYELGLIRDAVTLVATGGSTRVVLAGLRYGDRLGPDADTLARAHGLTAVRIRGDHGRGSGIAIERQSTARNGHRGDTGR